MARRRKYDCAAGKVYVTKRQARRVVATFTHAERGIRVVYSIGGDQNRECGYVQFRRWATGNEAKVASPTRDRVLKLK